MRHRMGRPNVLCMQYFILRKQLHLLHVVHSTRHLQSGSARQLLVQRRMGWCDVQCLCYWIPV